MHFVYFVDVPSGLQSYSYQSNDLKGMRVHNEKTENNTITVNSSNLS